MAKCGINLVACQSSNIAAHGHDAEKNVLAIRFKNGSTYQYAGVDAELYDRLRNAESIGRFLNAEIRGGDFEVTKMDPDEKKEESA